MDNWFSCKFCDLLMALSMVSLSPPEVLLSAAAYLLNFLNKGFNDFVLGMTSIRSGYCVVVDNGLAPGSGNDGVEHDELQGQAPC